MRQIATLETVGFYFVIKNEHAALGNIKRINGFLCETSRLGAFVAEKKQAELITSIF